MKMTILPARSLAVTCAAALAFLASGCSLLPGGSGSSGTPTSAATASATEAADAPSAPGKKAEPAKDIKIITAPTSGLTFGVPEDWMVVSKEEIDSDKLAEAAKGLGTDEDALRAQLQLLDLYAIAPLTADQSPAALTVSQQTLLKGTPINETTLKLGVNANGGEAGTYSKENTANGEAHMMSYTIKVGDENVQGLLIVAPTPLGEFAQLAITAKDEATRDSVKETFISSLR